MKSILINTASIIVGIVIGYLLCLVRSTPTYARFLRKRRKEATRRI